MSNAPELVLYEFYFMNSAMERKPHAALDISHRLLKAKKIENLLEINACDTELRLLEVGTGSGGIANYFANYSELKLKVYAVDVVDSRVITEGYDFQLVGGVVLPFEDGYFDVVISNHVIEHVGLYDSQCNHVKELKRVLKKDGVGYLAVPNRWMLVEPHYKLIFLSWLPKILRTPYVKLMGKGNYYDCEPLQKNQIEFFFIDSGLLYENRCIDAIKLLFFLERPKWSLISLLNALPSCMLKPFLGLMPTLIYTFKHK